MLQVLVSRSKATGLLTFVLISSRSLEGLWGKVGGVKLGVQLGEFRVCYCYNHVPNNKWYYANDGNWYSNDVGFVRHYIKQLAGLQGDFDLLSMLQQQQQFCMHPQQQIKVPIQRTTTNAAVIIDVRWEVLNITLSSRCLVVIIWDLLYLVFFLFNRDNWLNFVRTLKTNSGK